MKFGITCARVLHNGAPVISRLSPGLFALLALIAQLAGARNTLAFPPAPHHVIYGLVRDELGNPLQMDAAEVVLETSSGMKLTAKISPNSSPGQNYEIFVPMDSGISDDLYMPTAMRPTVPFKLKVRIGGVNYLPIEMKGDFAVLGQPGKKTRLNLTLGVDSDSDGLPDAWERSIIAALGGKLTLADIKPEGDSDSDGMSNINEYLAGTYAFDKQDGFALTIKSLNADLAVLEFLAIRGRAYTIQASSDLRQWANVPFRVLNDGSNSGSGTIYQATDVRVLQIETDAKTLTGNAQYFKLMIAQ